MSGWSELLVRAAFPRTPDIPNDNDPASVPPATVGPPTARPGDPNGIEFVDEGPAPYRVAEPPRPARWSGWPAEWDTPNWGYSAWNRLDVLTDTAWMCLDLNASLLSTMPPYLVGASPSLPADWLSNPDPTVYTSWEEFAKQLFWDYQMGEVFVLSTARYANGFPARFRVVAPWLVDVDWVDGLRRYTIGQVDVTADMLHVRYQSTTDDARGHGPLEAGRDRLVAARMLTRYGTNLAASGAIPNAVLTHPDELSATQAEDLQARWVESRLSRMGLPAVLSGGVTFQALQLAPKDMALVELLQFNEARIAVALQVPPFLVGLPSGGDSMTYSNTISLFLYHWRAGLRPKAQTVMAALSYWLTPRGTRVELNRDEYIAPEPLQQAQLNEILNRIRDEMGRPVMSVDEIRAVMRLDNSAPDITAGVLR